DRRRALAAGLAAPAALALDDPPRVKGNIKQSVCRWCYGRIPLAKLAAAARKIGYQSIELLFPRDYKTVKDAGLSCAMISCGSIADGLNRKENHDRIVKELTDHIEFAASESLPNVICMSGNRRGLDDEKGLETCAAGLKRVLGLAEKKKVTVCMEGLNNTWILPHNPRAVDAPGPPR